MKILPKKKHVDCYCDFCGWSDKQRETMIDGKHAFICSECVKQATALLGRERPQLSVVSSTGKHSQEKP